MAVTRIKNNQITDSTINAAAKLADYSITSGKIANNLTYNSSLTVAGNLTVQGNVTAIDTVDLVVEDPLIVLAKDQTGTPALDIGFIGERGNLLNIAFIWNESATEFATVFTEDLISNTTITVNSYANLHTLNLDVDGNIDLGGNIAITGNITGDVDITGNLTAGNLAAVSAISAGTTVTATGNITGGNLNTGGRVVATGNVAGGNITTSGDVTTATVTASSTVTATGNITGGNLNTGGRVVATGNVTGGNLTTAGLVSAGTTITATGNITGGNLNTAGQAVVTGNITGGNLNTAGQAVVTGNITGGNLNTGGRVVATGNVTGGNITTSGDVTTATVTASSTITATGNVTGGNLTTAGDVTTATVTASGNITGGNLSTAGQAVVTGNITGGNLNTGGRVVATGNVTGGNLTTAGDVTTATVTASGNITGGNLSTAGRAAVGTLETTGNTLIGGNLVVQGNITYINIDDLRVEDPIIILGTGPNGTPLTTNDGKDRGIYMEYYTTGLGNAFVGWQNSSGNMIMANDVEFSGNDVVQINSYGNLNVGNLFPQSINLQSGNLTAGNVISTGIVSATGNVTGGNLITAGLVSAGTTITATGNITGGNLNTAGQAVVTGNITGGNLNTGGRVVATGNVTGGNLTTAGALSVTGNANVGNIGAGAGVFSSTVTATGNVSGGNITTAGQVAATGNVSGGNILAAGNVNGGNLNVTTGVYAATGYFTGNVDVLGNLNATVGIVYANSGIFYGDAVTGNNAAFAGIPNFTPLGSNVVMQFAGNVNSYSQLNFQNINAGNAASTDYIATADNGDDNINYINLGINSSTFDDASYPGFGPNDGYVHNHGGNLILNPESAGKTIKLMVGGTDDSDVIANVSTAGVDIVGTVTANTGANLANIRITADNITSVGTEVVVNDAGADVNFRVEGDTQANLFVVDAGSDTVLIGTGTATTNAALKIGTTNSILIPVGTTLERPDTPVTGMVRFNTSLDNLEFYDSDSWAVAGSQFTVIVANTQTGNGIQTAFTLPQDGTTAGTIVAINGVVQIPVTAYSVTGNVCTFTEAPEPTDVIDFRQLTTTAEVTGIAAPVGSAVEVDQVNIEVDITGNMIPTSNVTYSLGNATNQWNDLYLAGNTIFLGPLRLEAADDSTFVVYKSDGTTQANIDVGNVDVSAINSGTSIIGISQPNGNAYVTVGGTANVLVVGTTTSSFSSALTATGNITGGNLNTGAQVVATGNVTGGNLRTATVTIGATGAVSGVTTISASGNANLGNLGVGLVTASSTITATGNITGGNIITAGLVSLSSITKTGSNGVGNIGSASSYFNTVFAKATSAQYADLAEMYEADADYEPGTVLSFGGAHEVTLCDAVADTRVAGVVSTNPSYLMNSALEAEHVAAVALQGRVPCKVIGPVQKGDLMTSAGNGQAKADNTAGAGTIIGKALEDFDGSSGVIEVVVGRS